MSKPENESTKPDENRLNLVESMHRVKMAQADRDDVVVEMRQAARARLELLAKDLQPVFAALPKNSDQFEFALTDGENARLWIDMTSFVRMGRDRQVYEFVKDTRLGRTILADGTDRAKIGEAIADYVAERVLERERAIEGDWIAMKSHVVDETGRKSDEQANHRTPVKAGVWFLFGIIGGAVMMVAWAWFSQMPAY